MNPTDVELIVLNQGQYVSSHHQNQELQHLIFDLIERFLPDDLHDPKINL